jgi:predicted CXXCH cytochrome family protein
MRNLIRYVTRKSRGGTAVRDDVVESEKITVGRGNDCHIHLPDPRVMLRHAEFTLRGGTLYVSAATGADLRIDENLTQIAKVDAGQKVRIGPYEIELMEKTEGFDLTLAVELVQALGDDLEKLVERSKIHITSMGLTMRQWVWLLVFVVVVGTFAAPFGFNLLIEPPPGGLALAPGKQHYEPAATGVWSSGGISAAHKFFGASCESCHEKPFVPVRDQACLNCHSAVQNHAQATVFPFADLAEETCQSCHKEHQGNTTIVRGDERFCASCHGDLDSKTTRSTLGNASDFGRDHPEFRPTVVRDPALHAMDRTRALGATPAPVENSGLKFPHDKHLRATGVKDPARGVVTLQCVDCHTPNETGETMQAISFERNCHSCHILKFDTFVPDRELVHGKPEEVFKQVQDVYDALAMRGGYEEPEAPALLRRKPGTPLTPVEKQAVTDWAAAKTANILQGKFGRGLCEECHKTFDTNAPTDSTGSAAAPGGKVWTIEPPTVTTLWMPKAYFTHARHTDVPCAECHAANTSITSADVLLPGIAVCQACHGGEKATDRVPSTCVDCHRFHRKDLGPMRPEKTAAGAPHHGLRQTLANALPQWGR